TWLTFGSCDRVPTSSGDMEDVTGLHDELIDGLGRFLRGEFHVVVQGSNTGRAVEAPSLTPRDLENDHVMVVPVDSEPFLWGPRGVGVHLDGGAQPRFHPRDASPDRRMHLIDGVDDQGRPVSKLLVEQARYGGVPIGHASVSAQPGVGTGVDEV